MRCSAIGNQTTIEAALSEPWLRRADEMLAYYRKLRDAFEPGKPLWLTETADAASGGNPWAGTFLENFRYLDQLGRLAKGGVKVVAHNTLVGSDDGLLDDKTPEPKPNYWAALLWHGLMGQTVLESGIPIQADLHLCAYRVRGAPGGVALLAINNSRTQSTSVELPMAVECYTFAAPDLEATQVRLNGLELKLDANDRLPHLEATSTWAGTVEFALATIAFLAIAGAKNSSCRW